MDLRKYTTIKNKNIFTINSSIKRNRAAILMKDRNMEESAEVIPGGNMLLSKDQKCMLQSMPSYIQKQKATGGCIKQKIYRRSLMSVGKYIRIFK